MPRAELKEPTTFQEVGVRSRDLEWGVAHHTPYPRFEVRLDAERLGRNSAVLHFRTFCSSPSLTVRRVAPRVITSNISSFLAGSTTISAQIRNPGEISLKSVYKPFYIIYMVILYIIHDILYIFMYGVIYGGHIIYMTFDINPISTLGIDW